MADLSLQDVSAGYGGLTVVHGATFAVRAGEGVGIVGPNGAGKSTLLKVIAGALPTQRGSITFAGEAIERRSAAQRVARGVALVPEGRQIIRDLTVQGNLDITLLGRRRITRDREHHERLENVYGLFPRLRERRRVKGGELSGGEQQMLAIGRALMCEPRLLLLDEPSLGLAGPVVAQLIEALTSIRSQVTLILAEHSTAMLDGLTSRRLEIRMGRISGSPGREHHPAVPEINDHTTVN
jgi:branched-chain amino acid transport system ATP-binding protein